MDSSINAGNAHRRRRTSQSGFHQDYQIPFKFTGKIDKLTFSIAPPVLRPDDVKKLANAHRAAQDAN
jgi:hypothetical protein